MTAAPALKSLRDSADLRHLRQIIAGLDEGVILIDPDQSILWANAAALAMHGVDAVEDLGATVDAYRQNDTTPGALTPSDLIRVASELRDPAIALEVGKAAAACRVLP